MRGGTVMVVVVVVSFCGSVEEVCCLFAKSPCNMLVYLRDGSA